MISLLKKIGTIGDSPDDCVETKFNHSFLIYIGLSMSIGGIIWGSICLSFDLFYNSIIPYSYTTLTFFNFIYFSTSKNFKFVQNFQVLISLLLPFCFQWSLGGFIPSGGTMLWAMLALMGTINMRSSRANIAWLLAYLFLTFISGLLDPYLSVISLDIPDFLKTIFFVLNFSIISTFVIGLNIFFVNRKERLQKILIELEKTKALDLIEMSKLEERQRGLKNYQKKLEHQVKKRTEELSQARKVAEDAAATKASFLANMSHEIRTPMNAIIGLSELCLKTPLNDKQNDYVQKINYSGKKLLGIINDILDFSKIDAGKLDIEKVPFSFDDIFDNLTTLLNLKAHEKNIELLFFQSKKVSSTYYGVIYSCYCFQY